MFWFHIGFEFKEMISSSTNSPPPSGTPPLSAEASSNGGHGRTPDPLSPTHAAVSTTPAESALHGRSGTVVSSTFGSGRDYTFSHLHAQSGQVDTAKKYEQDFG